MKRKRSSLESFAACRKSEGRPIARRPVRRHWPWALLVACSLVVTGEAKAVAAGQQDDRLQGWRGVLEAVLARYARSADDSRDEAVKQFKEKLQGKWQMTSRIEDGVPSDAELVKNRTITVVGDNYTVKDGEKVVSEISYKIDPAKKPAWLDVVPKDAKDADPGKGIIQLEGDTLTFCVGVGLPRPSDFQSKPGEGLLLLEFKRVKK